MVKGWYSLDPSAEHDTLTHWPDRYSNPRGFLTLRARTSATKAYHNFDQERSNGHAVKKKKKKKKKRDCLSAHLRVYSSNFAWAILSGLCL